MAAGNPLQRLRQDPTASFTDDNEALGSNTPGHFVIRILSYLVLNRGLCHVVCL
jgi:hypothetical protein